MKRSHSLLIAALSSVGLAASAAVAQTYYYTPGENGAYYTSPPVPAYPTAPAVPTYSADQLRQLLGPIALYPDPLLTQILAAATYPQDIASAQEWIQYFPNPSEDDIAAQPWDPSVQALLHYPAVLNMLATQPDWTAALGAAFANQPQDVMNTVQQLRSEALAANTLATTPQQQVVNDNGIIEILPAQPNIIYVPQYDPGLVYSRPPYYPSGPIITFGPHYGIGPWLNLDWDWRAHHVNEGVHWDRDWHDRDRRDRDEHLREWRHNPGRPIIIPHNFPDRDHRNDRTPDRRGPGWNNGDRNHHDAFNVHQPYRPEERQRAPERPVIGIPNHPAPRPEEHRPIEQPRPQEHRPIEQPRPQEHRPVEAPRPEQHRPTEQPRPSEPSRPAQPPRFEPQRGGNFVSPPTSAYNRRPVEGLPHPSPAPAPISRPTPAPAQPHNAPAPAFHNDGGGANIQAGRGHQSMRR
ncbi:MAG: DUF3300 domain-containing protein [Phycisphaerae bacterium]